MTALYGIMEKIQVSLEAELLKKLDTKRGIIPRSAYIRELVRKDLENVAKL